MPPATAADPLRGAALGPNPLAGALRRAATRYGRPARTIRAAHRRLASAPTPPACRPAGRQFKEHRMTVVTHADTQMPLRIARIHDAAEGIRSFELVQADGSDLPPFTPGSHVRVQVPSGAGAQVFALQRPGRAAPLRHHRQARRRRAGRLEKPVRRRPRRRRAADLAARQRLPAGRQGEVVPLHRRRHRHHADPVDDPLVRRRCRRRRGSSTTSPARPPAPPSATSCPRPSCAAG